MRIVVILEVHCFSRRGDARRRPEVGRACRRPAPRQSMPGAAGGLSEISSGLLWRRRRVPSGGVSANSGSMSHRRQWRHVERRNADDADDAVRSADEMNVISINSMSDDDRVYAGFHTLDVNIEPIRHVCYSLLVGSLCWSCVAVRS